MPSLLVQAGGGHAPKSVRDHLVCRVPQTPQRRVECVVAYRAFSRAKRWKEKAARARDWLQVVEDSKRLARKWDKVGFSRLHPFGSNAPESPFKIHFAPFSLSKLTRADEHIRRELKSKGDRRLPQIAIDSSKQLPDSGGLRDGRKVASDCRSQ